MHETQKQIIETDLLESPKSYTTEGGDTYVARSYEDLEGCPMFSGLSPEEADLLLEFAMPEERNAHRALDVEIQRSEPAATKSAYKETVPAQPVIRPPQGSSTVAKEMAPIQYAIQAQVMSVEYKEVEQAPELLETIVDFPQPAVFIEPHRREFEQKIDLPLFEKDVSSHVPEEAHAIVIKDDMRQVRQPVEILIAASQPVKDQTVDLPAKRYITERMDDISVQEDTVTSEKLAIESGENRTIINDVEHVTAVLPPQEILVVSKMDTVKFHREADKIITESISTEPTVVEQSETIYENIEIEIHSVVAKEHVQATEISVADIYVDTINKINEPIFTTDDINVLPSETIFIANDTPEVTTEYEPEPIVTVLQETAPISIKSIVDAVIVEKIDLDNETAEAVVAVEKAIMIQLDAINELLITCRDDVDKLIDEVETLDAVQDSKRILAIHLKTYSQLVHLAVDKAVIEEWVDAIVITLIDEGMQERKHVASGLVSAIRHIAADLRVYLSHFALQASMA